MELDAEKQRAFAVQVVGRLVEAGYTAYWAGGCVRDRLLGRIPKDYDVATSARPDEVRDVFGRGRTHAVGAAFGVITVAGPRGAGHVEVTTFRRDVAYSDGRHPDAVEFSSPVDDAGRRDFTINGLFYDPLADQVIDLVGGRADLDSGVVRAIGDARARFAEDKLRMLRSVRFAAAFDFRLDAETAAAIVDMAEEIVVVSAERIAQEMRQLLVLPARAEGLRLLAEVRLLPVLLPELATLTENLAWNQTLDVLRTLPRGPSFPLALAATLHRVSARGESVAAVSRRWKLSNKERERTTWLLSQQDALWDAANTYWPRLQRLLISPGIEELISLHEGVAAVTGRDTAGLQFCRQRLARTPAELNPAPLVCGHDLIELGLVPSARFQTLLEQLRDAQLEGRIATRAEALDLAKRLHDGQAS